MTWDYFWIIILHNNILSGAEREKQNKKTSKMWDMGSLMHTDLLHSLQMK